MTVKMGGKFDEIFVNKFIKHRKVAIMCRKMTCITSVFVL